LCGVPRGQKPPDPPAGPGGGLDWLRECPAGGLQSGELGVGLDGRMVGEDSNGYEVTYRVSIEGSELRVSPIAVTPPWPRGVLVVLGIGLSLGIVCTVLIWRRCWKRMTCNSSSGAIAGQETETKKNS
jgi:hypothetical protein